jgi:translation initiation factor IF-2
MCVKKVRVYELAKELNLESKTLVDFLVELGADIKNHMSTVESDIAEMVREHFLESDDELVESDEEIEAKKIKKRKKHSKRDEDPEFEDKKIEKIAKNGKGKVKTKGRTKGKKQRSSGTAVETKTLELPDSITVKDLGQKIGVSPAELIKKLIKTGVMVTVNQSIDFDTAAVICAEYNIEVKPVKELDEVIFEDVVEDDPADLEIRPPIVTIMGHVDHGKTTLLDGIRKSRVAAREAGGITQHIGAYQVEHQGRKITFLDTPGHEAFTAIRSRGAQVTDIAVLVVAADDGVMPQTVEAISHARAADVPIIVAINKMDLPNANPDRVKQELSEHGLIPEAWGGDTIMVEISALTLDGVDELLEMILLVSEMEELKANPNRKARGTVIEAKLDKHRGPVATVLINTGTLEIGDDFVVGCVYGRVRAIVNDRGENIDKAVPAQPVEIVGISEVPEAGDVLVVTEDEQTARQVAEIKRQKQREQELRGPVRANLEDLFAQIQEGQIQELNIILKADVQGSLEALRSSLEKLSTDEVRLNVIHKGVGGVSESDVQLAATAGAIIIAFNVRPDPNALRAAEREKVDIRGYRVIYDAIDEVKAAMSGLLEPEYKEEAIGRAEVRETFRVPGVGTVAGCYVMDGKVTRSANVRVLRDNVIVHEGKISSLKRFKDDVREVLQGYECGIGIERFNDIKVGDFIEAYIIKEIARSL